MSKLRLVHAAGGYLGSCAAMAVRRPWRSTGVGACGIHPARFLCFFFLGHRRDVALSAGFIAGCCREVLDGGSRCGQPRGPRSLRLRQESSVAPRSMGSEAPGAEAAGNKSWVENAYAPRFQRVCHRNRSLLPRRRAPRRARRALPEPMFRRDTHVFFAKLERERCPLARTC